MTYKHREQNEDGEIKLRLRETQGNQKLELKNGEAAGIARQRAIEKSTGIRKASNSNATSGFSAASRCSSAAGASAPSRTHSRTRRTQ